MFEPPQTGGVFSARFVFMAVSCFFFVAVFFSPCSGGLCFVVAICRIRILSLCLEVGWWLAGGGRGALYHRIRLTRFGGMGSTCDCSCECTAATVAALADTAATTDVPRAIVPSYVQPLPFGRQAERRLLPMSHVRLFLRMYSIFNRTEPDCIIP